MLTALENLGVVIDSCTALSGMKAHPVECQAVAFDLIRVAKVLSRMQQTGNHKFDSGSFPCRDDNRF